MVQRNVTFISQKKYDKVRIKCVKIVKESIISKDTNAVVDEVPNCV